MNSNSNNDLSSINVIKYVLPIFAYNIIQFSFTIVDSIMVAPLGEEFLGAIGQAGIFMNVAFTFFIGMLGIYTPLLSRLTDDEEKQGKSISYFWSIILLAFVITPILLILLSNIRPLFMWLDQPVITTAIVEEYVEIMKLAAFPTLVYSCLVQTANTNGFPTVILNTVIISNLINIVLNWIFIYGKLGFPEMGVDGSAYATLIVRWFMVIFTFIYLNIKLPSYKKMLNFRYVAFRLDFFKQVISKGTPRGLIYLNDWAMSFLLVLMIGWGGVKDIAGNQVTDLISSTMYMVPQAFCVYITIIVSRRLGSHVTKLKLRQDLLVLFRMILVVSILVILLVWILMPLLLRLFSLEEGSYTYALSQNIMYVHLTFFLFYTLQYTMLAVLDSFLDTKIPSLAAFLISYGIVVPGAVLIMKHGYDAVGVWIVEGLGSALVGLFFTIRLLKLLKNYNPEGK